MYSLWINNFEKSDIKTPVEIIQEQCIALADITDGKIIARISDYDNEYTHDSSSNTKYDELGEFQSELTYEFFLTSKNTPKYKYRAFFIKNKIIPYPVKILLEESIADELSVETTLIIQDEEELLINLKRIFNCKKVREIINSLLSLN